MTTTEMTETIAELASGVARLQAMVLGLVADADRTDLAAETGQVNTTALLRALTLSCVRGTTPWPTTPATRCARSDPDASN